MSGGELLRLPWGPPEVRARVAELQARSEPGDDADVELVRIAAAAAERDLDARGLMLYAGTNAVSSAVAQAHDARLGSRAICGLPGQEGFAGLPLRADLDALEVLTARAVAATMRSPHADVRPQSATLSNLAVFAATLPVGATIASMPAHAGGHFSHHAHGAAGIRGHRVVALPVDAARLDVDLDALPELLERERPGLVILGGSVQLFPNDVGAVAALAHAAGARVLFDASHSAGLIPGGAFPNPLDAGADALTFSTYKSYGGPPGGAIVTRDAALAERAGTAVFPGLTANYDVSRLRPLHAAAAWLLRDGARYGELCVAAARALATALAEDGSAVMAAARGFTATNQLLLRMPDRAQAHAAVRRCAEAGICLSVTDYQDELGRSFALRLGVQELVRRGLGPAEMPELAALVGALVRDERPAAADVRRRVEALREAMGAVGELGTVAPA